MKNHVKFNGRLVQENKKYSQLKQRQKEKIINWLYQETKEYVIKHQAYPSGTEVYDVVDPVYKCIQEAGIWIPYGEILKLYRAKLYKIRKQL